MKVKKIFGRGLGGHYNFLIINPGRRRLRGDNSQLEVVDDPVHHGELGDKGNDAHLAAALGTKQRVDFINLFANSTAA